MRRRSVSVDISALPTVGGAGDGAKKKAAKKASSKSSKDTKLLEAAFKGNVKEIRSLLKKGSSIHCKDEDTGELPLHLACIGDQGDAVKALLAASANPNLTSSNGTTAAHLCCTYGHLDALRGLLAPPDFSGEASRSFSSRLIDLRAADAHGNTPVTCGINAGNIDCVRELLKYDPKLASFVDQNMETPLHVACSIDAWKAIPLLVEASCDVNARNHYENTPLHISAKCGNIACVVALLANGADCTLLNQRKQTALQVAHQAQHMDVVGVLQSKEEVSSELARPSGSQTARARVPSAAGDTQASRSSAAKRLASTSANSALPDALPPPPSAGLVPGADGASLAATLPSVSVVPSLPPPAVASSQSMSALPATLPPLPTGLVPSSSDASVAPRSKSARTGREYRSKAKTPTVPVRSNPSAPGKPPLPTAARPPVRPPPRGTAPRVSPMPGMGVKLEHPNRKGVCVSVPNHPPAHPTTLQKPAGLQRRLSAPMLIDQKVLQSASLPPPIVSPRAPQ